MQEIEFRAMGCQMRALLDTDDPTAQAVLAEVPKRFEIWEQSLSRFRENSELSLLNRRPGKPVRVSETLWQVGRLALRAAAQSDGLVTPTVLDALEAAGYDRSMSEPVPAAFASPLPAPVRAAARVHVPSPRRPRQGLMGSRDAGELQNWRAVKLDPRRRTITLPRGVRLDVAGVAKGWAADQAARQLGRSWPAMVDASGDIAVSGPRADGSGWPIGIENPFGKDEDLPLLRLAYESEATSTRGYRRWLRGDKWQHHIIDPRTGAPAETDVFSSTAIAPTVAEAEVAAKVALILGSRAGLEWIDARPQLAAFLILDNGDVRSSRRLNYYVWE